MTILNKLCSIFISFHYSIAMKLYCSTLS